MEQKVRNCFYFPKPSTHYIRKETLEMCQMILFTTESAIIAFFAKCVTICFYDMLWFTHCFHKKICFCCSYLFTLSKKLNENVRISFCLCGKKYLMTKTTLYDKRNASPTYKEKWISDMLVYKFNNLISDRILW